MGKEKPILFSGEMVRAILDGRKTQTRLVIKFNQNISGHDGYDTVDGKNIRRVPWTPSALKELVRCPYGRTGDRLWVRETWAGATHGEYKVIDKPRENVHAIAYAADSHYQNVILKPFGDDEGRWKPSIFMPRWASRISLEVVGVRVERLQDISESDAKAEGVKPWSLNPDQCLASGERTGDALHRASYALLWDELNFDRGFGWQKNPWVWVIEFKKRGGAGEITQ